MTTGIDRTLRRLIALALVLPVVAFVATGKAGETAWGIEQLMRELAQVKSAKATFVERKHMRILNAPLESSGTLLYVAPARLEKHTLKPRPESMVLDGGTLTFEDKARNRRRTLNLSEQPVLWSFVESIRSTLAGDLKSLNRLYAVTLEGGESDWLLTLDPREPAMQSVVTRIRITGNGASIRTIETIEAEGDRSVMTVSQATK